ncbi:MAG TPA: tetratricopeptide repeat protein [Dehalococcoidia bacterium]|nr:tetratricopeptide repeat protein [Dehalococcoidia bacterium]
MSYQGEERARLRRQRTKEAIALAMASRWQEAVAVNKSIIESYPTDIDAYNRLGRALMELGEYDQAAQAYSQALELDPHNSIARKNLERLAQIKPQSPPKVNHHKVMPEIFLGEVGKVGVVDLDPVAPKEVLARMAAGDEVYLKVEGPCCVVVENAHGETLGHLEPRHGLRLAKLIQGGNKYAAAIASLGDGQARVIIRETFQHPSQRGRPSFPVKETEAFRPYVRESLLRYELEEEAVSEEGEYISPEEEMEPVSEENPEDMAWGEEEEA